MKLIPSPFLLHNKGQHFRFKGVDCRLDVISGRRHTTVGDVNFATALFISKRYLTMKFALGAIICVFLVTSVICDEETTPEGAAPTKKPVKKLQIGVKKRVENCETRSSKGDILHIHYRGTLYSDGTEFDNSYKRGQPLTFTLGMGQVIAGWDQGLLNICAGEKRKLIIPPDLAYGSAGAGANIPPDSTLVFEVECVEVERKKTEL